MAEFQDVRDALAGMTPLSDRITSRIGKDGGERYDVLGHPCGFPVYICGDLNDAAGIVTIKNRLPDILAAHDAQAARVGELEAEVARAMTLANAAGRTT